ncbi:hypothetical protein FBEOM_7407 [Fusarium beomiforme]|uniref:BTB domain-containing protein n=1 Tax=Fusarium beomiforme TaxID=44412 RepID=A0A9P5AHH8_9HYPO|nr:hypothetical protein FBEOM_7407 [Fusarium beomiforme]
MKSISYDIDPGGDIELVLREPNKQNIVPEIASARGTLQSFDNPPCTGRYRVFSDIYEDNQKKSPKVEIHMRVSSRHLILASHTFRVMLEGPWSEATSSSEPLWQIVTEGWDAFALAIVLDSIHGRDLEIPTGEKMCTGLLTRIATIVDYYQCREALHCQYRLWVNEHPDRERAQPEELSVEFLMWLYISWVFSDDNIFCKTASNVLLHSDGPSGFDTHDLPVGGVLGRIDTLIRNLIDRVLEALDSLQEEMLEEKGCVEESDSDCTALMLGILMRKRHELEHWDPPLVAPFCEGYSIANVLMMVDDIDMPEPPHWQSEEDFE